MKLYSRFFALGTVALLSAPYINKLTVVLFIMGGLLFIVGLVGVCLYHRD